MSPLDSYVVGLLGQWAPEHSTSHVKQKPGQVCPQTKCDLFNTTVMRLAML